MVPRTVPFKQVREKKAPATSKAANGVISAAGPGQTTLDGRPLLVNGANGAAHGGILEDTEDGSSVADPNAQLELETRRATAASAPQAQNGWIGSRDVEMS